jgi:metal-dependent amidase/aminoacylase/carboxypeptidase family protein
VTVNDADAVNFVRQVMHDVLGENAYIPMTAPVMGAEDFSYVLERIPGAMVFLGVRPESAEQAAPCHSNRMMLNEDGMVAGMALHAGLALRSLAG